MDRSHDAAPWPRSPIGRDDVLRRHALGVRISPRLPICSRSPTAETADSKPAQWVFESPREHHAAVAQSAEAAGLNPVQCRIVACLRHRRLAQRKSVGPTNRRSRYRNSQRLPDRMRLTRRTRARPPPVAQWQSSQPITGRPGIVTVREDQQWRPT